MSAAGARGVDAAAARLAGVAKAWRAVRWGSLPFYADDIAAVLDALDRYERIAQLAAAYLEGQDGPGDDEAMVALCTALGEAGVG